MFAVQRPIRQITREIRPPWNRFRIIYRVNVVCAHETSRGLQVHPREEAPDHLCSSVFEVFSVMQLTPKPQDPRLCGTYEVYQRRMLSGATHDAGQDCHLYAPRLSARPPYSVRDDIHRDFRYCARAAVKYGRNNRPPIPAHLSKRRPGRISRHPRVLWAFSAKASISDPREQRAVIRLASSNGAAKPRSTLC